jgi:beta-carotene 15,15'-dioxygenase
MTPTVPVDRDTWFRQRYAQLTMLWCTIALLIAAMSLIARFSDRLDAPTIAMQMLLLAIGIALFGVPHGGLDHVVAGRVLALRGATPRWTAHALFFLGYTFMAMIVLVGWWLTPVAMLLLFLVASALHFALRDGALEMGSADAAWTPRIVHLIVLGAAPIVVPWLMYPREVGLVFGWLSNTRAEVWLPPWTGSVPYFIVAAMTAVAALTVPSKSAAQRWEVFGTMAIFVALPPLIAFAWYFCFLHALRHLLTLAHRLAPSGRVEALRWVAVRSLPLTIATVLMAIPGYLILDGATAADGARLAKVVFWGLAALTFPHMFLTAVWERLQSRAGTRADVGAPGNSRVVRVDELK